MNLLGENSNQPSLLLNNSGSKLVSLNNPSLQHRPAGGSTRLIDRLRHYSPQMRRQDRNVEKNEHEEDLNRLWLIVKHTKVGEIENHFELRGGEKIRIGRVIFTVKEIVNDKIQYRSEIGDSASRI